MKIILSTLLLFATVASATTITINRDTSDVLDFSIEWGPSIDEFGCNALGTGGSTVAWLGEITRNRNFYFVEVDAAYDPSLKGFGIQFWSVPEYYGPVPTAYGSPNITFSPPGMPTIYPLDYTPYGARFVFTALVPDGGGTGLLLALGLVGLWVTSTTSRRPRATLTQGAPGASRRQQLNRHA